MARQRDIDFRQRKLDVINKMAGDRAAKGERLTSEEADFIMGLSQQDAKHDPQTIMETEYARQFFNRIASRKKAENIQAQIDKDPDEAVLDLDIASNIKARQEVAKTIYDQLDDRKHGMGWGETLTTYGSQLFISPLESYRLHNVVSKDRVTFLPGNNLSGQVDFMWTLPPPEFKRRHIDGQHWCPP